VTLASRREDEGKKLVDVADKNDNKAEASLQAQQELNRRQGKTPVLLERRDHRPATSSDNNTDQNPQ